MSSQPKIVEAEAIGAQPHASVNPAVLRIAVFVPTLQLGGAEKALVSLSRGLSERGHTIDLLVLKRGGILSRDVPESVRLVDFSRRHIRQVVFDLRRYLRQENPDVLISGLDAANVVAVFAARSIKSNVRVVVTVHQNVSSALKSSRSLKRKLIAYLARGCYRFADAIAAVSQGVAEDLVAHQNVPSQLVHVVPNPVILPESGSSPCMHDSRRVDSKDIRAIASAGRFQEPKDFETLIRAVDLVRKDVPVRLVLYGDGPLRGRFELLIAQLGMEDVVEMPGVVRDLVAHLRYADLFVLSSRSEGFSMVLVEALAAGCRIVSTDCPSGPREILDDGQFGALVTVGDPQAMCDAIIDALSRPSEPLRLQLRSEEYTLRSSTDRYIDLISLVLGRKKLNGRTNADISAGAHRGSVS